MYIEAVNTFFSIWFLIVPCLYSYFIAGWPGGVCQTENNRLCSMLSLVAKDCHLACIGLEL